MHKQGAAPRERGRADVLRRWWRLARGKRVAAVLRDAVGGEIVAAAAGEAGPAFQLDSMRPFGRATFAASVLLQDMANEIVVAVSL